MLEGLPIILALCFMLWHAYYAQNYAGIIDAGLVWVMRSSHILAIVLYSQGWYNWFATFIVNGLKKYDG